MENIIKEEKKDHIVAGRISKSTYDKFLDFSKNADLGSNSKALAAIVELFLDSKMTDFTKKDLNWIKYIYFIDSFANDMVEEFKKQHPEDANTVGYMEFLLTPFYRLTESTMDYMDVVNMEEESKILDGITILSEYIKKIKFEYCSLKKMSKTFGVALQELEVQKNDNT